MGVDPLTRQERLFLVVGAATLLLLSSFGITHFPLPWWDEGWTLSVAKNWVTAGHYGHVINGVPAGPSLSAHLPVVAIVAAAFLAFGIGIAQARMAMVTCAVITLVLLYLLTRRVFSRQAAALTMVLICALPAQWDLSILIIARNVLGEVPALMFIVLALLLLLKSQGQRMTYLIASGAVFGVALATKAQVVPFVVLGLAVMSAMLMVRQRTWGWTTAGVLALALSVMYGIGYMKSALLSAPGVPPDPVAGLTEVTAIVLDPEIRLSTLRFALFTGGLYTLALSSGLLGIARHFVTAGEISWTEMIRGILVVTASSWFFWYVGLSIGWGRYAFPALVLAAPVAADLTHRLYQIVRAGSPSAGSTIRRSGAALLLLFFAVMAGRQTVIGVQAMQQPLPEPGLERTASFVNVATPAGSTIETYESELLFVLDRPVHVPPAQLNVDLIRKNWLNGSPTLSYDVGSVRADYLIVGMFGTGVYDRLVVNKTYVPVCAYGSYTVYRRAPGGR